MLPRKPLLAALALTLFGGTAQAADEVVVYSSRIDELIKPVFDAYTAKTGVKIKFITDKEAPLMQRIKAEGDNGVADLLLTVDAGNLWQAEQMGILQPIKSDIQILSGLSAGEKVISSELQNNEKVGNAVRTPRMF